MFLREAVCRLDRDPMESSAGGGGGGGVVVIRGDAAAPVASSSSDQRGKRRRRLRLSVQEAPEGTPSKHSSRSKSLQVRYKVRTFRHMLCSIVQKMLFAGDAEEACRKLESIQFLYEIW